MLTPPDWVFESVWVALYLLIEISGWRLWWRKNNNSCVEILVYGVQVTLNLTWPSMFFDARSIGFATIELMILWMVTIPNLCLFRNIDRLADSSLIPYFF